MTKYEKLKTFLIKCSNAYYKENKSIISDYEFDIKLKELEQLENEQGFRDTDSPTLKPGSDLIIKENNENKHKRPMLSLENTYNISEIEKWYNDMRRAIGEENPEVVVNPKWDGNSGALRFSSSGLYKALTRGTGTIGENITQNVRYCNDNIWSVKKFHEEPFIGEARGEIIMTKTGFDELNKEGKYQNARNLVSGSLKLLNLSEFIPRAPFIKFYAYWLEDSKFNKYSDDLEFLKSFNFDIGDFYICHSLSEINDAISKIEKTNFDVAIDGAVMKLNEKKYWSQIGETAKFPRWAKAYKYKQEEAVTTVTKIEFWTARTGKVTPVIWFNPVFIDGSTIQKATLNNEEFYRKMNIALGDEIIVHKAAAIIPQIVNITKRPVYRQIIPFPKVCPCCGTKLIKRNEDHTDYFCNNENCRSRIVDKIVNYTHSIECDGFADILVERFHEAGLLNNIADLYTLNEKKTKIASLERMSISLAEKLCNNIEESKKCEFWKTLAGLGIPNVGPKTAKILANHFKSIESLESATQTELEAAPDIAEITASGIVKWCKENHKLIQELEKYGVNLSIEEKNEHDSHPTINLEGKTFCITGALSLPRNKYIELIEGCGGKVSGSVSAKTSYLITNDKTTGTSKNVKARQLGIPILNEKELLGMCDALNLLKEIIGE